LELNHLRAGNNIERNKKKWLVKAKNIGLKG
jgi:hypothetical protein